MKTKTKNIIVLPATATTISVFKFVHIPFDDYIKADPPRAPESAFGQTATVDLGSEIGLKLSELGNRAAAGEKDAAALLHKIAREAVIELTALCNELPELLKPIARECPQWPVMASAHHENQRANLKLFEKLRLGTNAEIEATSKSKWDRANQATIYANAAINMIRANQERFRLKKILWDASEKIRPGKLPDLLAKSPAWVGASIKLPPLSKSTARAWWKVGKAALLEKHPKPEKVPEMKKIVGGEFAKDHSQSEIRARILDLIGRTVSSMAKK